MSRSSLDARHAEASRSGPCGTVYFLNSPSGSGAAVFKRRESPTDPPASTGDQVRLFRPSGDQPRPIPRARDPAAGPGTSTRRKSRIEFSFTGSADYSAAIARNLDSWRLGNELANLDARRSDARFSSSAVLCRSFPLSAVVVVERERLGFLSLFTLARRILRDISVANIYRPRACARAFIRRT